MKNLKVWQKLALMGLVFMVPFAAITWKMVSSIDELGAEFARQESRGLVYYRPLLALLKDLQQHRGMASAWRAGDASFKERLAAKSADIEKDLEAVGAAGRKLGVALGTAARWTALEASCRALLQQAPGLPAADSFARHTQAIDDTLALIAHVSDASKLTLDPDLDSYYLMSILVFQGPQLSELLAQARGLGAQVAAAGGARGAERERLTRLAALVAYLQEGLDVSVAKAIGANAALRAPLEAPAQASAAAMGEAGALVERLIARPGSLDAAKYFAAMTQAVDALYALHEAAAAGLEGLLAARIARFEREIAQILSGAALGLAVISLLGFLIMRDITRPLRRVVTIADQIAEGDLSVNVSVSHGRRDEVGVLARSFDQMVAFLREMVHVAEQIASGNLAVSVKPQSQRDMIGTTFATMVGNLAALVGQVQKSGIQVNSSVNQIAATSKQQQATATQVAATTVEVGATAKEIAATSKELVRTVGEVSKVADHTALVAGEGHTGLTRMEDTMRQVVAASGDINAKLAVLNEKAGNIGQVVTTITKVAEQTNLLSLNAAIEAEKAGEYGRGFSVVATEIRRLADQTAVATYDIEQMVKEIQSAVSAGVMGMDKFSEEVRRGLADVQQVGTQLSQIIQQVQALAPRFEEVNEGMQAQATGAEQITQALSQLNEAAQQTVESLRQSTQAIDGLNEVSGGLRSGVSRFKLMAA